MQTKAQKEAIKSVYIDGKGKHYKWAGKIDFVAGWYYKASQLMKGTSIQTALVSTNSITQGEQVEFVWRPLIELFNIKINFAYQTFKWESEASEKAAVHCVIIGFGSQEIFPKYLFSGDSVKEVKEISPYLIESPTIFLESRSNPISTQLQMHKGSQPTDGGNLLFSEEEYNEFIKKEPSAKKFIRPYLGAKEFINNIPRYCLWLVDASPSELNKMPLVKQRLAAVREKRLASPKKATQKSANTPHLFQEIRQPNTNYIIVPSSSSENRRYIPIGLVDKSIIATNASLIIPNATLYHFGILTSNVHMAWMRTVAGRLKSDYRYSAKIVYNNFPWVDADESTQQKIAQTAQAILDARALYPDSSLADLYDELTMPAELRKAHQANDKAVMTAYGMTKVVDGKKTWLSESETVARLFEMYEEMTGE